MSVSIESLGVSVSGPITRRYDQATNRTGLTLTQAQAQELYDALGPVLKFFDLATATE